MEKFDRLVGIGAPLREANIDTDQILPKQFLKVVERKGLARALFYDLRFDSAGNPQDGFVLTRAPYDKATILIAGENFACGSSREHAVWALVDFGIRCVIAPSFGEIFFNNSFNNGLLPIAVPQRANDRLLEEARAAMRKKELKDVGPQWLVVDSPAKLPPELAQQCLYLRSIWPPRLLPALPDW